MVFHFRQSVQGLASHSYLVYIAIQSHLAVSQQSKNQDTCRLHMSNLFAKLHKPLKRVKLACSSHLVKLLHMKK